MRQEYRTLVHPDQDLRRQKAPCASGKRPIFIFFFFGRRCITMARSRSPTMTRKKINRQRPRRSPEATLETIADGAKAAQHPLEKQKTAKHLKIHHGWSQCRLVRSSCCQKTSWNVFVPHDSPHRDRLSRLTFKLLKTQKKALGPRKGPRRAPTASLKRPMASMRARALATRRPKSSSPMAAPSCLKLPDRFQMHPGETDRPKRLRHSTCSDDLSLAQVDLQTNVAEPVNEGPKETAHSGR